MNEYRSKTDRFMSALIVTSGLTTAIAAEQSVHSHIDLVSSSGTQAARVYEIGEILSSAQYSLTYHREYVTTVLMGKVPMPQYHSAVLSDTALGKSKIEKAMDLMNAFHEESKESRPLLENVIKTLPENTISKETYSTEVEQISVGKRRFVDRLDPAVRNTYLNLNNIAQKRAISGVIAVTAGALFLGFMIGAAITNELSGVGRDIKDFTNAGRKILKV